MFPFTLVSLLELNNNNNNNNNNDNFIYPQLKKSSGEVNYYGIVTYLIN